MEFLGKCILSFFLSEALNCFYFTCGFVKENKKLQISLCSIYLVWPKIPRKMCFFQQRHFLGSVVLWEALRSEGKFVLVAAYFHGLSLTWLEVFSHYWERLERKEGQVVSWEKIGENYNKICAVKWENQHLLAVCFLSCFFGIARNVTNTVLVWLQFWRGKGMRMKVGALGTWVGGEYWQ